ncbi:PTS glucose transporter subunit IIBC, partial [Vibrio vulnificus]
MWLHFHRVLTFRLRGCAVRTQNTNKLIRSINMFKNLFANLQKVGKALMLPVSVLPVAGIL